MQYNTEFAHSACAYSGTSPLLEHLDELGKKEREGRQQHTQQRRQPDRDEIGEERAEADALKRAAQSVD